MDGIEQENIPFGSGGYLYGRQIPYKDYRFHLGLSINSYQEF